MSPNISFLDKYGKRHFVRRAGVAYMSVGDTPDPDAATVGERAFTLGVTYDTNMGLYFEFSREGKRDMVRAALMPDTEIETL